MNTARRGISNHALVEAFERVHRKLTRMGYSAAEAERGATAWTLALSGVFTRQQVWDATDAILGPAKPTTPNH